MWTWIKTLDQILRGEVTRIPALRDGDLQIPVVGISAMIALLGIVYGACMGLFSITPGGSGHAMQLVACMIKVPLLYLLTLIVTFPSLYVFNALVGSRLQLPSVLRLLIGALAVILAVLSSIGPIVAFFSFSTTSYPFMVLLNVLVFAVAGILGMIFLLQSLHRLSIAHIILASPASEPEAGGPEVPPMVGPLDGSGHALVPQVKTLFRIWVMVFGLVGAQMAWVLSPFVGKPGEKFIWFHQAHSNFFEAVFNLAIDLFGRR